MHKPTVIVICGPTASGKTALGVELAKKINGEVVSADSMQIYKEMDIGRFISRTVWKVFKQISSQS